MDHRLEILGNSFGTGAEVVTNSTRDVLLPRVLACAPAGTTVYTDEWSAYGRIPDFARPHATVCHNPQGPGGPEP